MEGIPKFKHTKTTAAGYPVYERTDRQSAEQVPGELTEEQQEDLRSALAELGVPLKKNPQ